MLLDILASPETFRFVAPLTKEKESMLNNATFIGRVQHPRAVSTGCLLSDGTLLTCLHAICDLEKAQRERISAESCYYDLTQMEVFFVKDHEVYVYKVIEIVHDGLDTLAAFQHSATNFDYARLVLDGDPIGELGAGLVLDQTNHFSSAFSTEPTETLAISGPTFYRDDTGQLFSQRLVSTSKPDSTGYYTYPQLGSHATQAGSSGLAIFPLGNSYPAPNNKLYAIHSGREVLMNNSQTGVKCSGYLSNLKLISTPTAPAYSSHHISITASSSVSYLVPINFRYENLRRNGLDRRDIILFLTSLAYAIYCGNTSQIVIPAALKPLPGQQYVENYQLKHLFGTGQKASSFYAVLGRSAENVIINTFANCVNKIVSHYYQLTKGNYPGSTNFIVNLGFNVGIDDKTKNHTSYVQIQGFGQKEYHIFPKDISKITPKNTQIVETSGEDFLGVKISHEKFTPTAGPSSSTFKKK